MTDYRGNSAGLGESRPQESLAWLIRKHFGMLPDPDRLRDMIIGEWEQVQRFAHAIHRESEKTKKIEKPAGSMREDYPV